MKNLKTFLSLVLLPLSLLGQWSQPNCDSALVFYWDAPNGTNFQGWQSTSVGGSAASHGLTSEIFIGLPEPITGLPAHVNGSPDFTFVDTDFNVSDVIMGNNPQDQSRYYAWVFIPANNVILRDTNSNSGEFISAWVGKCCGPALRVVEDSIETIGTRRGISDFVVLDSGFHFIALDVSDVTAFGGVDIEWSFDNGVTFANIPSANLFTEKPKLICKRVKECGYVLQPGESWHPMENCTPYFPAIPDAYIDLDPDPNNEIQTLGILGNNLTLTGSPSVDLSFLLDNTDSQTLTFTSPNLGISGGNSVDLSSLLDDQVVTLIGGGATTVVGTYPNFTVTSPVDPDDDPTNEIQGLSLVGNTLSLSLSAPTVDLSAYLDVPVVITGSGSVTVTGTHPNFNIDVPVDGDSDDQNEIQTLTVTTEVIYHEFYSARSANGLIQAFASNSTITRTGVGQWTVLFTTPHPDGTNYTPEFYTEEDANRDNPKIVVVEGTLSATGFDVMITVDDNGTTADPFSDQPWGYGVEAPTTVVTGVTISN